MKKFIVSTDVLKPILAKVGLAVPKSSMLPVLTDVYCKVTKGEIEFISSDLELTIRHTCSAETTGHPFELLIPFDYFKSIVNLSSHQPLTLQLSDKSDTKATIICEGERYELNELDSTVSFPKMPVIPTRNAIEIDDEFISWINKALIAVSKDVFRPAMQKVCLDVSEKKTVIAATDAHCLLTKAFDLPSKTVDQLLLSPKISKVLSGVDKAAMTWSKSHIAFQSGNLTIVATRFEDKYPAYRVVMLSTEPNLEVNRNLMIRSLEKCGLSTNETKKTTILLSKHPGRIVLESIDVDMNREILIDVEAEYSGDAEFIAINSELLLKMLAAIDHDMVRLHIASPSKGIMISTEDDANYMGMVMPLML